MHQSRYDGLIVLSLALIVLTSGSVLSQTILPPVQVTAPPHLPGGGSLHLERPSSAGSRLGLTLQEQPAAVEVVPGEAIRERGDYTAQEAATRATGITAAGTPGDGSSALTARGFAGHSSVSQLYDGTRLYVGAGTVTFPIDTWLLDRIEVLHGPASVLHGVGAIGGAINYVPRQPRRDISLTDGLFVVGTMHTYQLGLNSTGPLSDRLAYQVGAIGTQSGGYVDDGELRRLSVASALTFDVTPTLALRLAFDGTWNEPARYWGTPLNEGRIDDRFRERNYNVSDSVVSWGDYWLRLGTDWRPVPAVQVRNELYYLNTDRRWKDVETYELRPTTFDVLRTFYIEILHDEDQIGNRLDARFNGTIGERKYRVLAGFDVNRIRFRRTSNIPFEGESTVNAFAPVPGLFINTTGTRPEFDTRTTQVSFFGEGLLHLTSNLKFLSGLRVDHIDYSRDDILRPSNSFDKTFTPFTWRVGSVFDITRSVALYGQITRGVDPLDSLITLRISQRDFKLTTGMQYEMGLKAQFFDGRAQATLAGYYIEKKNLLAPDETNPTLLIQVGKQSSYGMELALGLTPIPQLSIDANFTVLNARFDDLSEEDSEGGLVSRAGNQPVDVPEFAVNLFVVYRPVTAWRLGTGVRHVGERFADNANTVREPSYTLLDAFVTYAPARFIDLTLRGRNLTDASPAIASYGSSQFILGPPRAVEFAASFRF
ncbi:MAG: TonB-dependent receptor [Candidatus Tectimicrobiota bacterium]